MKHLLQALVLGAVFSSGAAFAQGIYPLTPPPAAEIQVFIGYRGVNDYDFKFVSYPGRLITAAYLYPSDAPVQNGACFYGEPYAALELWQQMVDMMNVQARSAVGASGLVYFDPVSYKPALHLEAVDSFGQPFVWFERMRECDRPSTPDERLNVPAY